MGVSKAIYFIMLIFFVHNINTEVFEEKTENTFENNRAATGITILGGKQFMLNVAQEFVNELEEYGFCNFEFSNFTQNITRTHYFGYEVIGNIDYTYGFINSIEQISIKQDPTDGSIDEDKNAVSFTIPLTMSSLNLLFNYAANLTEGYFSGTVIMPYPTIEFSVQMTKYYTNETIATNFHITATSAHNSKMWYYEPSNHYTEIINREIHVDIDKDLERIANTQWKILLENVLNRIPFPELCFMCTNKK